MSEYPPSLTYAALELGLLCVILAAPSCCSTRRVPLVSNVQGGTSELGPEVSLAPSCAFLSTGATQYHGAIFQRAGHQRLQPRPSRIATIAMNLCRRPEGAGGTLHATAPSQFL